VVQDAPKSIADGLTAPITGAVPFAHLSSLVDSVVRVSDDAIRDALGVLVRDEGVLAEPAAAAGLAALLSGAVDVPAGGRVVLVISGGTVDPDLLRSVSAG
jgi:threonine dehydratase